MAGPVGAAAGRARRSAGKRGPAAGQAGPPSGAADAHVGARRGRRRGAGPGAGRGGARAAQAGGGRRPGRRRERTGLGPRGRHLRSRQGAAAEPAAEREARREAGGGPCRIRRRDYPGLRGGACAAARHPGLTAESSRDLLGLCFPQGLPGGRRGTQAFLSFSSSFPPLSEELPFSEIRVPPSCCLTQLPSLQLLLLRLSTSWVVDLQGEAWLDHHDMCSDDLGRVPLCPSVWALRRTVSPGVCGIWVPGGCPLGTPSTGVVHSQALLLTDLDQS